MSLGPVASLARRLALVGSLVACLAPTGASAEDLTLSQDSALMRMLLRYSPLVFDVAVQVGRGFAEIGYERRGYDPVTNSFHVSGLRVKRDALDVSIGRLRTDLTSMMVESVEVDTRGLDLSPQMRQVLAGLGRSTLSGDFLYSVRTSLSRSAHDVALRYEMPDFGAFELTATIDNFHVLLPLAADDYAGISPEATVAGDLIAASLAYEDRGLMALALDTWSQDTGLEVEMLQSIVLAMPMQFAQEFGASLHGGASPELRARIIAWAAAAEDFLRSRDAVRVTLAPPEPVALARLQAGRLDEALVVALNPSVARGFARSLPAPAPSGSLAAANALISGAGAPQNREDGARTLLGLAATGAVEAVRAIGDGFGNRPPPDLSPAELAELYETLLVARALGGAVEDWTLDRLAEALPAEAVLAAERDAAAFPALRRRDDAGAIGPETIAGLDASAIRAAAYDHHEGRGVPRSRTRALALALVAAAAGDPFAASLRDTLSAAAQRGLVVLDLGAARGEAAVLWAAFRTGRASEPQQ